MSRAAPTFSISSSNETVTGSMREPGVSRVYEVAARGARISAQCSASSSVIPNVQRRWNASSKVQPSGSSALSMIACCSGDGVEDPTLIGRSAMRPLARRRARPGAFRARGILFSSRFHPNVVLCADAPAPSSPFHQGELPLASLDQGSPTSGTDHKAWLARCNTGMPAASDSPRKINFSPFGARTSF